MSTGVVLLAAGSGRRFGGPTPKQFLPFQGEPLFLKSLRTFASVPSVSEIVLVVSPEAMKKAVGLVRHVKVRPRLMVAQGGKFRGESVRNGLYAFAEIPSVVLIHDSARPLVDAAIIRRVEQAAQSKGAALAAWPLPDTLKRWKKGVVAQTIPRKDLWVAQTPQGFKRKVAETCLLKPLSNATDDVELAERKGFPVKIVLGSAHNFKITHASDLKLARSLIEK